MTQKKEKKKKKKVYFLLFSLINYKKQNEKHMPMKNAFSVDDNCTVPSHTFIFVLKKKQRKLKYF
jgi:hypothetical protein